MVASLLSCLSNFAYGFLIMTDLRLDREHEAGKFLSSALVDTVDSLEQSEVNTTLNLVQYEPCDGVLNTRYLPQFSHDQLMHKPRRDFGQT